MKTERRPVYIARDKSEHPSFEAGVLHERLLDIALIGGADEARLKAALNGTDPDVLTALENLGNEARTYRKANGGSKRKAQREAPHARNERRATA